MDLKLVTALLFILLSSLNCFPQQADLTIEIKNISMQGGQLMIGLFDDTSQFKAKTDPVFKGTIKLSDSTDIYTFKALPSGKYAIAIFHDANENDKLDKKKLGIPNEGVGFSGGDLKGFKPPDFKTASFDFSRDTLIVIPLKYPRSTAND